MSSAVTNQVPQYSTEVAIPEIFVPENGGYSRFCEMFKEENGEHILGFKGGSLSVSHQRALANLAAEVLSMVVDPDWVRNVERCKMPSDAALRLGEMGLLLHVEAATSPNDVTILIVGLTTPYCSFAGALLEEAGTLIHEAFKDYAKKMKLPDYIANVQLRKFETPDGDVREAPSAKSQFTYLNGLKDKDTGEYPCDPRALVYFPGWATPAGVEKLKSIQDEFLNNEEKYFGFDAEIEEVEIRYTSHVTGREVVEHNTLRENSIALMAIVSGDIACFEKTSELMKTLPEGDSEDKILRIQHAASIARMEAYDAVYIKHMGIGYFRDEIPKAKSKTYQEFSLYNMDNVLNLFSSRSTEAEAA